jgi:hypothetical protein
MKIKSIALALALLALSAPTMAQTFGDFTTTSVVDDFTDEKTIIALANQPKDGMYTATYGMRCEKDGSIQHLAGMGDYVTGSKFEQTNTLIRFDKGEVWKGLTFAVNRVVVFREGIPIPATAESVVVQVEDFSGDTVKTKFSIKGFGEALTWITAECSK